MRTFLYSFQEPAPPAGGACPRFAAGRAAIGDELGVAGKMPAASLVGNTLYVDPLDDAVRTLDEAGNQTRAHHAFFERYLQS